MSLTYTTVVQTLANLLAEDAADSNFVQILPSIIAYAENRIYRELDMLAEDVRDSSASTTAGSRNFTLPISLGTFQIVREINVITPAATAPESGTRNPLTPVSLTVLDWSWPSSTGSGVPEQFAYFSQASGQTNIVLGPWPDAAYRVEVVGKIIPTPLSEANPTTFLTLYLEDLFISACMIFGVGAFQKNWGASPDDPNSQAGWERTYATQKESAATWEARKRFAGASWTATQPEPTAVPQRG